MPKVIVKNKQGGVLAEEIISGEKGEHFCLCDEPIELGGQNTGPTPYDFLLSALGSCTAMTIIMYSKRKNWPLESIEVDLTENRVHAQDCADCESGYIHEIKREIKLNGPLSDEQRERLLVIASHCPVHKTLMSEIRIRDTLLSNPS